MAAVRAPMRQQTVCAPCEANHGRQEPARSLGESREARARLAEARRLLEEYESRQERRRHRRPWATGLAELDDALGGGVPSGTVCEIVSSAEGLGALSLALRMARATHLRRGEQRHLFLIDPRGDFYPPAAARLGLDLERLVIVRPASRVEALWAMDQALRCGSVGAAVGLFGVIDARVSRRLQLAAETGGGVGLLVRGDDEGAPATFAALRMYVEATERRSDEATKWERDIGTERRRDEARSSACGTSLSREPQAGTLQGRSQPGEPGTEQRDDGGTKDNRSGFKTLSTPAGSRCHQSLEADESRSHRRFEAGGSRCHRSLEAAYSWDVLRKVRVRLLKARPWMKAASIVVELSSAAGDVRVSAVSGDRSGDARRWAAG